MQIIVIIITISFNNYHFFKKILKTKKEIIILFDSCLGHKVAGIFFVSALEEKH